MQNMFIFQNNKTISNNTIIISVTETIFGITMVCILKIFQLNSDSELSILVGKYFNLFYLNLFHKRYLGTILCSIHTIPKFHVILRCNAKLKGLRFYNIYQLTCKIYVCYLTNSEHFSITNVYF